MKNPSPLVSILMPAFNAEKFIAAAINSILKQNYSNWELLILNDASSDSTQEIIEDFKNERIKVFHHSQNQGYLISCNELFAKATGNFITFLDADDVCSAKRIEVCLNEFKQDAELDFLTTGYARIDEVGEQLATHPANINVERYSADPGYFPTVCCATIFLRKELLDKVGGYRPFFKAIGGEDYYWLWELSRAGKGMHQPEIVYDYRFHSKQISRTHKDDLSLFLPELLAELRKAFQHSTWNEQAAAKIATTIREQFVLSDFELRLRKAQFALNQSNSGFGCYLFGCLVSIRAPKHIRPFMYLVYSWIARKGGNADQ